MKNWSVEFVFDGRFAAWPIRFAKPTSTRPKDRIALKGDENAGRVPASALDFGILSGDGAGLGRVPFVTAKLFIAGAPWTNLAEIDIPNPALDSMENRHKIYLVLYGPRRETSAFPEKEA